MKWAFHSCARSPRRRRSSPTPSCAWRVPGGFGGYEDFREPFREAIRQGKASFPDRARWLQVAVQRRQSRRALCRHGQFRDLAISRTPSQASTSTASSRRPRRSGPRAGLTLGVGVNNSNAATSPIWPPPAWSSSTPSPSPARRHRRSGLGRRARRSDRDDLQALSPRGGRGRAHRPRAGRQGDRRVRQPASPIIIGASSVSSSASTRRSSSRPRCRPSPSGNAAVLRHRVGSPEIVERVERFHRRRHELGIYTGGALT
jgi:hypothetical protein